MDGLERKQTISFQLIGLLLTQSLELRLESWQNSSHFTYLVYLVVEPGSSQDGLLYSCLPLLYSVHLRVSKEMVPVRSCFVLRRIALRRSLVLPAPLMNPLFFRFMVVWLMSSLFVSRCSHTRDRTVAGSRVSVDSFTARSAKASARLLPLTPECPGQKIHRTLCRLLCAYWSCNYLVTSLNESQALSSGVSPYHLCGST